MNKNVLKKYFKVYLPLYGLAFFVLLSISLVTFVSASLKYDPHTGLRGWMWNAYQLEDSTEAVGLGWVSMSCFNDFDNDRELEYRCTPVEYGVEIIRVDRLDPSTPPAFVRGCAWSGAYGWICFNGGAGGPEYQCDTTAEDCTAIDMECSSDSDCQFCAFMVCSDNAESCTQDSDCNVGVACTGICGGDGAQCSNDSDCSSNVCNLSVEALGCGEASENGVIIEEFKGNGTDHSFYYLDSPAYTPGSPGTWASLASSEIASIISLYEFGPTHTHIGFPFAESTPASIPHENVIGCMGCDPDTNTCEACLNVSSDDADEIENPNPNILCWDCGGTGSDACLINEAGGNCVDNRHKNLCPQASCAGCTEFTGVLVNDLGDSEFEMCGWAYHAYDDDGTTRGLGWISVNALTQLGTIAYIDVQEGSILSGGMIYAPGSPPAGKYNAAYIIEASGDITNWYSANAFRYPNLAELPEFLQEQTGLGTGVYKNVLGGLDYVGAVTAVEFGTALTGANSSGTNKYGSSLELGVIGLTEFGGTAMNNNIVYFENYDYIGDESTKESLPVTTNVGGATGIFEPGDSSIGVSGAGMYIIEDDVDIHDNLSYGQTPVDALSEIPSVVWIIKGDLTVDIPSSDLVCSVDPDNTCGDATEIATCETASGSCVHSIAGTFIVLGDGVQDTCPDLASLSDSCGRFSTGSSDVQLRIHGTVMAKQISFERFYGENGEPSELFIPDGRLQANTPAGLTDFSKSVPRFSGTN